MKTFLGVHNAKEAGLSSDKIADSFRTYKEAASKNGITAQHAYYSEEKGFAYCITEANSEEEVRKAHQEADIPLVDAIEVEVLR